MLRWLRHWRARDERRRIGAPAPSPDVDPIDGDWPVSEAQERDADDERRLDHMMRGDRPSSYERRSQIAGNYLILVERLGNQTKWKSPACKLEVFTPVSVITFAESYVITVFAPTCIISICTAAKFANMA